MYLDKTQQLKDPQQAMFMLNNSDLVNNNKKYCFEQYFLVTV